jgi:hypothetical protein
MTEATCPTIKYDVFHSCGPFFATAIHYGWPGITGEVIAEAFRNHNYHWVYAFELPSDNVEHQLEVVFRKSNNIEESWNPLHECRSTSVGDIVQVGRDYYVVAAEGFDKLPI